MRLLLRAALPLLALALGLFAAVPGVQSANRSVTIVNGTTFPLMNLYATQAGVSGRKNFLPTSSRISAGESKTIDFDTGATGPGSCMRDLEFDLTGYQVKDGNLHLKNVDICKTNRLELKKCGKDYCAHASH